MTMTSPGSGEECTLDPGKVVYLLSKFGNRSPLRSGDTLSLTIKNLELYLSAPSPSFNLSFCSSILADRENIQIGLILKDTQRCGNKNQNCLMFPTKETV